MPAFDVLGLQARAYWGMNSISVHAPRGHNKHWAKGSLLFSSEERSRGILFCPCRRWETVCGRVAGRKLHRVRSATGRLTTRVFEVRWLCASPLVHSAHGEENERSSGNCDLKKREDNNSMLRLRWKQGRHAITASRRKSRHTASWIQFVFVGSGACVSCLQRLTCGKCDGKQRRSGSL